MSCIYAEVDVVQLSLPVVSVTVVEKIAHLIFIRSCLHTPLNYFIAPGDLCRGLFFTSVNSGCLLV